MAILIDIKDLLRIGFNQAITNKIENTKEVLIYCSTRLSLGALVEIVAIFIQLYYTSYVGVFVQLHLQ